MTCQNFNEQIRKKNAGSCTEEDYKQNNIYSSNISFVSNKFIKESKFLFLNILCVLN